MYRRLQSDMIQVYKIINDIDIVKKSTFPSSLARGHKGKKVKRNIHIEIFRNSTSHNIRHTVFSPEHTHKTQTARL